MAAAWHRKGNVATAISGARKELHSSLTMMQAATVRVVGVITVVAIPVFNWLSSGVSDNE
jgi:hypothetical protein